MKVAENLTFQPCYPKCDEQTFILTDDISRYVVQSFTLIWDLSNHAYQNQGQWEQTYSSAWENTVISSKFCFFSWHLKLLKMMYLYFHGKYYHIMSQLEIPRQLSENSSHFCYLTNIAWKLTHCSCDKI